MRKIFTSLKSVVAAAVVASMALAASCSYDDTAIVERVTAVENDLAALTERVAALESKLEAEVANLTALINGKVVVTAVETDAEGVTTVTLSDGKSFKVYPKCTVVDTDTDTDTNTYLSIKEEDGVLYWAIYEMGEFKEWLLLNGEKVAVYDGNDYEDNECDNPYTPEAPVAPQLRINTATGNIEISIDNGATWVESGLTAAATGVQIFTGAAVNGNTVTFTLFDGSEFNVALVELIEFEAARSQVYVMPGATKEIRFSVNDAVVDINVMNQPFGWSATVELAPAADENIGGGYDDDFDMGVLAAGGTDYLLKVSGPSVELARAGFAAKEGVVSVHFNTASGACKVAQLAVNLAEITLDIDANGNVTLVNSVAVEQTNYWGEKFTDFADFFIGVLPKSLYDTYGKDALLNDLDEGGEYMTAASTQRSSGLNNIADLQMYEEGVYEKETITFTMDKLAQAFWPRYSYEYGVEYIVFVTLDSKLVDYYQVPVLDNAVMASYNKTAVEAALVEGSEAWNDVTYNFTLAGYNTYLIGWMSEADVEMYLSYGLANSVETLIPAYIQGMGLYSSGAIVSYPEAVLGQDINLASFAELSLTGMAPELAANTKYYFYVYPFNAADENEVYTHEFVAENLRLFGTFETAALVAGSFETGVEYELLNHSSNEIAVNVTFGENASVVYYTWTTAPALEAEEAANAVLADLYATCEVLSADYRTIYASKYEYYGLSNPVYLSMVVINANGEYVYVEEAFEKVEAAPTAVTEFKFLGRYKELDNDPSTGGGDYVYTIKGEGFEYTMEVFYTFCNADGTIIPGTYSYCWNTFDAMYSSWCGFSIIDSNQYFGSTLIVEDGKITLNLDGVGKYVYEGAITM